MKTKLKDQINDLLNISKKPECFMKIFIQAKPGDEPVFYKQIPWDNNINVSVPDEKGAASLAAYLTRLQIGASVIEYIVP